MRLRAGVADVRVGGRGYDEGLVQGAEGRGPGDVRTATETDLTRGNVKGWPTESEDQV